MARMVNEMRGKTTARSRALRSRVFIVDGHPIVRHGIAQLINHQKDLIVCGEADDQQTALMQIAAAHPDGVIVDVTHRCTNGLELIKKLRHLRPTLPVLVFSIHNDPWHAARALRAGAKGYLAKQEHTDKVLSALRTVLRGEIFQCVATPMVSLTRREREVLRLLGHGHGTRQIARELSLSCSTVEGHRQHIKRKLSLHSAVALVRYATRWVEAEERCKNKHERRTD